MVEVDISRKWRGRAVVELSSDSGREEEREEEAHRTRKRKSVVQGRVLRPPRKWKRLGRTTRS